MDRVYIDAHGNRIRYVNHLMDLMERCGIPLTLEAYLDCDLMFTHYDPQQLDPEYVAELPPPFQAELGYFDE